LSDELHGVRLEYVETAEVAWDAIQGF